MSGPTLTMAPAVALETSRPFGRSHSSPDLLSHATSDSRLQASSPRTSGVLGSKSLSSGCGFDIPSFEASPEFDTRFFLDGKDLALGQEDKGETVVRTEEVPSPLGNLETGGPSREKPGNVFRRFSTVERSRGKLSEPRTASFNVGDNLAERPRSHAGVTGEQAASAQLCSASPEPKVDATKRKKPADSFVSFARRTWITTSRSPSPSQSQNCEEGAPSAAASARNQPRRDRAKRAGSVSRSPASSPSRKAPVSVPDAELPPREGSPKSTGALHRASSYLTKFRSRPQSMLVKFGNNNRGSENDSDSSRTSSATSLHNPGLTTISIEHEHPKSASFVDTSATSDDECSSGDMPAHRDPLWKGFKELEVEFDKFDGKTTAQRMQLVRATLLVFLRGTSNHYSNKCLHPEDLDRRASILDKWWKGLLDLLDGKGLQPLPGVDRPVLLDAVLLIMTRPEWRQATTYLMPLSDRSPAERVRARSWTNSTRSSSLSGSQAEFIAESAEHNVRTTFVANLLSQMAIVVEKMSLRHAPISLVNFCGRTCAYAFFFAPGAAEILVRLWILAPETIRRAADGLKLPRTDAGESEDIVALFPPCLAPLGWKDARKASSRLKTPPKLSLALARVPWNSPWVSRWRGGDTDLFFIFCKYFHILSEEFMPPGLPLVEKARSPGFVLVQAQLLTVLDSTIHRQAAADAMFGLPLHDPAQGADASAMALSTLPNGSNLMKNMSENRLVVLLKNFLSEDSFRFTAARHTFAEAFVALLRATTIKTSLFDHNACFTLCDFLEEALIAYDEFEDDADRPSPTLDYVDWSFWFDVLKKMMASRNAMTEVRALSFIFSTWDAVTSDPRRKEALCLDWLLTEKTFNEYFNHWCPMVRAYFMRLLCWRICRDAGSASDVDTKIFLAVSARLKTTWGHYLYLKYTAEDAGKFPPSTAPCLPTPGKKFMIIRTEVNTPQPGLFLDFDSSFSKSLNGTDPEASSLIDTCASGGAMNSKSDSKKRWSLLGKVLSFTAGSAGVPAASSEPRPSWEDDSDLEQTRKDTAAARSSSTPSSPPKPATSATNPPPSASSASSAVSSDGSSTGSSPVYHEQQYVFKFILGAHMHQPNQPRERILTPPRLPGPAQSRMSARFFTGSDDHATPTAASPSIGAPTPPRSFSGFKQGGLVGDARNASPRGSPSLSQGPHFLPPYTNDDAGGRQSFSSSGSPSASPRAVSGPFSGAGARQPSPAVPSERAVRPTGLYAANAIYAGRALAEWGVIVAECNGFVDRRRHEGVAGLCDVEVPVLGVEGFRRIG